MAEHGSENELHVKNKDRQPSEGHERRAAGIKLDFGDFFDPFASGENGDGDGEAEKCLGERGVGGGDGRRQKVKNGQSAENALRDDGADSAESEVTHPAATIGPPGPYSEDDGEEAGDLGDHAMGVLELDAADEARNFIKRAEGSRPIRHRQAGVIAGNERAGDDQQECPAGKDDGKAMEAGVVRAVLDFQVAGHWMNRNSEKPF
jgi:hypothetical protein